MNKSQLRLLAAEAADGRIPRGEYRARRRELIDNIVAGNESIERVQPQWHDDDDDGDDATITLNGHHSLHATSPRTQARRFPLPFPLLLAAGSVLCVAIVTALLWPRTEPPVVRLTPPTVPVAEEIERSRALVESFVARRDFGATATADFRRDWQQLDPTEREQARNELWFGSLVRALRDEIKTQNALAGLTAGDAALQSAKTAFALGEFLGVSDKLPGIDNAAKPPVARTTAQTQTAPANGPIDTQTANAAREAVAPSTSAASDDPADTDAAPARGSAAATPTTPPPASSMHGPTGRQWLAAQVDDQLTLQIFAVNNLDRVEQLIAAHPQLGVQVLATAGATPRYRVFHGVFADEAGARQAYANLPADVTSASHGAIVKSFSVVRDDLRVQASTPASASSPKPAQAAADDFTLQLFATGNRDSAQALVAAFPALKLQLREMSPDPAPYRVVFGNYSSADEARSAITALPRALLARIGTPLPKPISSLSTPAGP